MESNSWQWPLPDPILAHHRETIDPLIQGWSPDKPPHHALLLTGPSGIGKAGLARWISLFLLCNSASRIGAQPCGSCPTCLSAIERNEWFDLYEIAPENSADDGLRRIKTEDIQPIFESLGMGPHQGAFRIYLITDCERFTPQAANALLKVLEEPPRQWMFILTASDRTLVLPTIASRCQLVRLKPLTPHAITGFLGGEPSPEILELALGSAERAMALGGELARTVRGEVFGFIQDPQTGTDPLLDRAVSGDEAFSLVVDTLESCIDDLLTASVSAAVVTPAPTPSLTQPRWRNADGARALEHHARSALQNHGESGARAFWSQRALDLWQARQRSTTPANRKLLVQTLLHGWLN